MSHKRFGFGAVAAALAIGLSGCSSTGTAAPAEHTSVSTSPTGTTPPAPTPPAKPAQETEVPASSSHKTAERTVPPVPTAPVEGAYPGAGGPRPAHAKPATAFFKSEYGGDDTALITTPSGNIGCELSPDFSGCGVDSWMESGLYTDPREGPLWWVYFDEGKKPAVGHRGDAPLYKWNTPKPQVVNYGEAIYYKDDVCVSEQNGLTCWSTKTGRGALLNKSGYKAF